MWSIIYNRSWQSSAEAEKFLIFICTKKIIYEFHVKYFSIVYIVALLKTLKKVKAKFNE